MLKKTNVKTSEKGSRRETLKIKKKNENCYGLPVVNQGCNGRLKRRLAPVFPAQKELPYSPKCLLCNRHLVEG